MSNKTFKYMKRMWRIKLDYVKGIFELAFVLLDVTLNGGVLHVWISFSRNLLSHSWLVHKASTTQKARVTEITMNCHICSPCSVPNMTVSKLFLDVAHGRNEINTSNLHCHNFVLQHLTNSYSMATSLFHRNKQKKLKIALVSKIWLIL